MARCLRWRIPHFMSPALLQSYVQHCSLNIFLRVRCQSESREQYILPCIHPHYSILLALTCSPNIHVCGYLRYMIEVKITCNGIFYVKNFILFLKFWAGHRDLTVSGMSMFLATDKWLKAWRKGQGICMSFIETQQANGNALFWCIITSD